MQTVTIHKMQRSISSFDSLLPFQQSHRLQTAQIPRTSSLRSLGFQVDDLKARSMLQDRLSSSRCKTLHLAQDKAQLCLGDLVCVAFHVRRQV